MSAPLDAWTATIELRTRDASLSDHVERALRPEAAREVPRSAATVRRVGTGPVEIAISARDTGAMRAAPNTYLGWIDLALAAARAAGREAARG